MKLSFQPPADGKVHTYCMQCRAEQVTHSPKASDRKVYSCASCGHRDSRALIIDPAVAWWVDKRGEYCHETAGIFLRSAEGRFLFFERVKHPVGLTVPAGHVDANEKPVNAVTRETREETGITVASVKLIATRDIDGDECRRGADMHRWHIYVADMPTNAIVRVDAQEGLNPIWLSLEETRGYALTPAVRYIITHFANSLA